jgi:hypothetical protein
MKLGVRELVELCIYCWGHLLLYTCSGSVAVWMLLSGNLQHIQSARQISERVTGINTMVVNNVICRVEAYSTQCTQSLNTRISRSIYEAINRLISHAQCFKVLLEGTLEPRFMRCNIQRVKVFRTQFPALSLNESRSPVLSRLFLCNLATTSASSIPPSTLSYRLAGRTSRSQADESKQILSHAEEKTLVQ